MSMPAADDAADPDVRLEASGVLVTGPQDAPAIVFVHGTRLTKAMWQLQQAALRDEFRTIALDLPGHGARADEPFTLDSGADAVSAAIHDHAAGRAIVVGLSLGGYVAMALAAREPERVRGLVLSGATAEPVGVRMLPYLALAAAMDRGEGERLRRLNTWFFRSRYPAAVADPIVEGGFWWHAGATSLRALAGGRVVPRLAAYPGPTSLVAPAGGGSLDRAEERR